MVDDNNTRAYDMPRSGALVDDAGQATLGYFEVAGSTGEAGPCPQCAERAEN